jgi:hypothetical protein
MTKVLLFKTGFSPKNIKVKSLASRDWKLYEGKDILELDARGLAA